jgi:hypothetical protein
MSSLMQKIQKFHLQEVDYLTLALHEVLINNNINKNKMAFKLDENLKKAFLKHRRGEYDKQLDGKFVGS